MNRFHSLAATMALLFLPILFVGQAQAQSFKVGFTDPDLIIAAMPEYRQIQQTLQSEYQATQAGLQAMAEDFQEKLDRYQKQQALLSEERRAERESELLALQEELQGTAAAKDEEFSQRQVTLLEPLLDKVQTAIDEIAKEQRLAMVLRAPALLYIDESQVVDITEAVAIKLGLPIDQASTGVTLPEGN